ATGTGNDGLHGLSGVDVLRGDNWASKPGGRATKGGRDLLTGGSGNDHLNGGPLRDDCSGGPARDRASKRGGWVIEVPQAPARPALAGDGAGPRPRQGVAAASARRAPEVLGRWLDL